MSKYLKHFSTVGDDYRKWHEEEEEEDNSVGPETLQPETSPPELLSFRNALKCLLSSYRFQVAVIFLVILDAVFVLCELLIDVEIIKSDKNQILAQVFHYLSLSILTFFIIEISGKIYAFRMEFFHHKFEVFDAVIVLISFVLDIVFAIHETAFTGIELLIILRLWRVARIVNGVVLSVKAQANRKIAELKEANAGLTNSINELQQRCAQQEQEINRLHSLLEKYSINYKMN
ncbi:voltage-gated hydrogen channel 1 [Protopterus annectens]|uniref:voltage-gated hydrogen channel 1 n=1 Tax=Protopterus annectens TaxID=7888 RepID=UPI001CFA0292|nr:voltage-gated hydrogen channel 1 [Protopterus annectens]